MSAEELSALCDSPDLHAAMLAVVRAWAARYHPECDSCSLYVWSPLTRDDVPQTRVTIPVGPSASADSRPVCEPLLAHS